MSGTVADQPIRVLVADDTRIHTQLLADALRRDGGLEVITSDSDSQGLVERDILSNIDVLVLSSTLDEEPRMGFKILRSIRAIHPSLKAIMLIDSSKREMVLEAFRAGARGVLCRNESTDRLSKSVRGVHQGQIWANSQQMAIAVEGLATGREVQAVDAGGLNLLSKRETEVVRCLAQGFTNREIAEKLGLSQHTVKNYLFRVFDKLGVSSRVELLFMTLSHETSSESGFRNFLKNCVELTLHDDASFAACQRSAEQGFPIAQLIMAQVYLTRKASPSDLSRAYTWCLVLVDSLSRTTQTVSQQMNMDQLLEAETIARELMRKPAEVRKIPSRTDGDTAYVQQPRPALSAD
jgi:DNA-binding NarL/FixJ family response regulator